MNFSKNYSPWVYEVVSVVVSSVPIMYWVGGDGGDIYVVFKLQVILSFQNVGLTDSAIMLQ